MAVIIVTIAAGFLHRYKQKNPGAFLIFASGQQGGVYVELAKEFKTIIEDHLPNVSVQLQSSAGSVENVFLIDSGTAQLALVQNDIRGSAQLRTVAPLHRDYLHILVRKNSGISSFRALDGRTFTTGLNGSGSLPVVEALTRYFSFSDQTVIQKMSVTDGISALREGKTDALMLVLGFRAPAIMDLIADADSEIEFLKIPAIEVEALKGFILSYPICETIELPPFSYQSEPPQPVTTLAIQTLLVADKDVPDEIIKPITEVLFAHRSELIHQHPAAAQMSESFDQSLISFPMHPGAKQYFSRDEPGFIMRYAEAMAFILSLMLATYGLITATRKWISQKQKDRIDDYYILVEQYLSKLENTRDPGEEEIEEIARSLKEIRHAAYSLLAREKLIPDASFRIFQHLLEQCEQRLREFRS